MNSTPRGFIRSLVIVLVLLLAVIWFLPAPIIKWGIEKYGSLAVGAKVEVESVDFSWLSTRLALKKLAVTNPQNPMSNMVALDQVVTELNFLESLSGSIYLNEVAIEGVALDTPRATSGAIPGVTPSPGAESESGFGIPGVDLPDTQTLVEQEKAVFQKKIQDMEDAIKAKEQEWKALQDKLPDQDKLDDYKKRLKALNENKDPLGRIAALNDMKKIYSDLKTDIKQFDKAKDQIKAEYKTLKNDLAALKSLPDKSVAEIVQSLGLEESRLASLGANMLEGPLSVWLDKGINYYRLMSGGSSGASGTAQAEGSQEAAKTDPAIFIALTKISGAFIQGGNQGEIEGTILNFSDAPALADKPIEVDIKAKGGSFGNITLDGTFDHLMQGKEKDVLSLEMLGTALTNMQLSESESLNLLLKQALLNLSANLSITSLESLDVNFSSVFKSLDFESLGEGETEKAVIAAVQKLSELIVDGSAVGTLEQPKLHLKSNLDDVLKTALGSVVDEKVSAFKAELSQKLTAQLEEKIGPLDDQLKDALGIRDQIDQQSSLYEDFKKKARK